MSRHIAPISEDESPDLDVVVCTLGSATLARAVDSLIMSAQAARARIGVIVVWQGQSSPPSMEGPVRVVDVFPLGLSYARNRGLAVARAPAVAFVDDDEVVEEGWVAAVLDVLRREETAAGVFGAVLPLDEQGLPHCLFEGQEQRMFAQPLTPPWVIGTGGNMAFRRRLLLDVGGFDPLLGAGSEGRSAEESDLIVRLLKGRHVLAWSPEMTVYHPTKSPGDRLASRYPYGFGMGRVARRHRSFVLGAKYLKATFQHLLGGLRGRDAQQRREAIQTVRGFLRGAFSRVVPLSPVRALDRAPDRIGATLAEARLEPLRLELDGVPHLRYAGRDLQLHVYVAPPEGLGEELAGGNGFRSVEPGRDALWVLVEGGRT
jgi:Glycosyl transferase family 2